MQYSSTYNGSALPYADLNRVTLPKQEDTAYNPARENNIQLLRFLTALVVTATHSLWIVYGLNPSTEGGLGFLMQAAHCGICIFFGLSGYLITSSLSQRPNLWRFTVSRVIRLCPLILVASFLIAFVFGPFYTTASFSEYYSDWRLWAYVPATTLSYADMTLPGLFETAPAAGEVNVTIWTLKYEIIAYFVLALLCSVGLLHQRVVWIWSALAVSSFVFISYFTDWRAEIPFFTHGLRFGFAFLVGVLLYTYRQQISLSFIGVFIVISVAYITSSTPYMEPFRIIALAYTALWFGSQSTHLLNFYNRFGDYSYGLFIFHWPIAQIVLQTDPAISYSDLLLWVMPLTLACAVISWHGIEAPLLERRFYFADRLTQWSLLIKKASIRKRNECLTYMTDLTDQSGKRAFHVLSSIPAPKADPQTPEQVASQLALEYENAQQNNRHLEQIINKRYKTAEDIPASFRPQATSYLKPTN